MKLDEFLTNALIESLQNGLIAPELIIVYAGNYLTKSLITPDEMNQVQNAVASASTSASEPAPASTSASDVASASASETTSAVASASASATASETAASNTNQPA